MKVDFLKTQLLLPLTFHKGNLQNLDNPQLEYIPKVLARMRSKNMWTLEMWASGNRQRYGRNSKQDTEITQYLNNMNENCIDWESKERRHNDIAKD